jgi:two-component system sensor histidine kinase KdpD
LAGRIDAEWIGLHVETPSAQRESAANRERLHQHLRLAESLGAEIVQVTGQETVSELIAYARNRNVTTMVIGKTTGPCARWPFRRSLAERVICEAGKIDVFVVSADDVPVAADLLPHFPAFRAGAWLGTFLLLACATVVALLFNAAGFTEANLVMIYLLAVVLVAARYGSLPSIATSVAAVLLFNVLFTAPYFRVTVHDTQYLFTFSVMFSVGLLASMLTARVRYQAEVARRNERRTEALYRLSRRLIAISDRQQLVNEVERTIAEVFDVHAVVYLPDRNGQIRPAISRPATFAARASEFRLAQWVFDNNHMAGAGTNTESGADSFYMPMATPNGVVGVLAVQEEGGRTHLLPDARQLLDTYATQIAFALEREQLVRQSQQAELEIESEKMRSALLSTVSQDHRSRCRGG